MTDKKEKAKVFMPEYRFKELFGENPEQYFASGKILAAERALQTALEGMSGDALNRLQQAVETARAQLPKMTPGARPEKALDLLLEQAFYIICHAGLHGYGLASDFAHHLYYYARKLEAGVLPSKAPAILEAHINAIHLIFREKIKGEKSPIAQQLLKELDRLAEEI